MNFQRKSFLILALLVCLSGTSARADRVDDYVREQMRLRHVPGATSTRVRRRSSAASV